MFSAASVRRRDYLNIDCMWVATSACKAGATWLYVSSVSEIVLWPRSSWTTLG